MNRRTFLTGVAAALSFIGVSQNVIAKIGLPRKEKMWFEKWYGFPKEKWFPDIMDRQAFIHDEDFLKYLCEAQPAESQLEWFKQTAQFVDYGGGYKTEPLCPGVRQARILTNPEAKWISGDSRYTLIDRVSMVPMNREEWAECFYSKELDDYVIRYVKLA